MDMNMKQSKKEPILEVKRLTKYFGGLAAVVDMDLEVNTDEIVALIGPNGAGKTTFFNCITGIYVPTQGDVFVIKNKIKKRINGLKPNEITKIGLARTFQNIRIFPNMTALENVMVGRHPRTKSWVLGAILKDKNTREEERNTIEISYNLLKKLNIEKYANEMAKNMPYGEQRKLEIARALATEPLLLLLDEPAAGLNPQETLELKEIIQRIKDEEKISVLLIEHDMKLVMNISHRVYVMESGRLLAHGTPQEIASNPDVIKAYLGEEHA